MATRKSNRGERSAKSDPFSYHAYLSSSGINLDKDRLLTRSDVNQYDPNNMNRKPQPKPEIDLNSLHRKETNVVMKPIKYHDDSNEATAIKATSVKDWQAKRFKEAKERTKSKQTKIFTRQGDENELSNNNTKVKDDHSENLHRARQQNASIFESKYSINCESVEVEVVNTMPSYNDISTVDTKRKILSELSINSPIQGLNLRVGYSKSPEPVHIEEKKLPVTSSPQNDCLSEMVKKNYELMNSRPHDGIFTNIAKIKEGNNAESQLSKINEDAADDNNSKPKTFTSADADGDGDSKFTIDFSILSVTPVSSYSDERSVKTSSDIVKEHNTELTLSNLGSNANKFDFKSDINDVPEEEEVYDENFECFLKELKKELIYDTTVLWDSFQSVFGHRDDDEKFSLIHDQIDPIKKKIKLKPDDVQTLHSIYNFTKHKVRPSHNVSTYQIVTDKKLGKKKISEKNMKNVKPNNFTLSHEPFQKSDDEKYVNQNTMDASSEQPHISNGNSQAVSNHTTQIEVKEDKLQKEQNLLQSNNQEKHNIEYNVHDANMPYDEKTQEFYQKKINPSLHGGEENIPYDENTNKSVTISSNLRPRHQHTETKVDQPCAVANHDTGNEDSCQPDTTYEFSDQKEENKTEYHSIETRNDIHYEDAIKIQSTEVIENRIVEQKSVKMRKSLSWLGNKKREESILQDQNQTMVKSSRPPLPKHNTPNIIKEESKPKIPWLTALREKQKRMKKELMNERRDKQEYSYEDDDKSINTLDLSALAENSIGKNNILSIFGSKGTNYMHIEEKNEEVPASPWEKVKLKPVFSIESLDKSIDNSVAFPSTPRFVEHFSPREKCANSHSPWAHICLKPVGKDTDDALFKTVPTSINESDEYRADIIDSSSICFPTHFSPQAISIVDSQPLDFSNEDSKTNLDKSSQDTNHTTSETGFHPGDIIDLNDLPSKFLISREKMSVIPIMNNMDNRYQIAVVGEGAVFVASRPIKANHENEVTLLWFSYRSEIDSLTLNSEATGASIVTLDGTSFPLHFETSFECFRFAQAFYQIQTPLQISADRSDDEKRSCDPLKPEKCEDEINHTVSPHNSILDQDVKEKDSISGVDNIDNNTTQSSLTEEEEELANKFRKMLKYGTPIDAVKHKMTIDGVHKRIMDIILSEHSSCSDSNGKDMRSESLVISMTPEEDSIASKYRKMLKIGIPPDVVHHDMKKNSVNQRIIDSVLGSECSMENRQNLPNPESTSSGVERAVERPVLSEDEEQLVSKFRKMIKYGTPKEAVRHKMKMECIDKLIIEVVLGKEIEVVLGKETSDNDNVPAPLTEEEEEIASKFRKMLKIGISSDTVRHDMKKNNIDRKIIEAVIGKDSNTPRKSDLKKFEVMINHGIPKEEIRKKMIADGIDGKTINTLLCNVPSTPGRKKQRMVGLHWDPISEAELKNSHSIWNLSGKKKNKRIVDMDGEDIIKLEKMFQKKENNTKRTENGLLDKFNDSGMAKLIKIDRAQFISISLNTFKDFTHDELVAIINDLDPERKIRGDRVNFLKDLLPKNDEVYAIQRYKGDDSRLTPAEIFFKKLQNVQRASAKVAIIETMEQFEIDMKEVSERFQTLSRSCKQVMESEKLQLLLESVLAVGNIMNEGTKTGGAAGFRFESLLKLTQTKSIDGKMTVLDYIVMTFIEKNEVSVLDLLKDFPECQTASRILITDMVNEAASLGKALKDCKTELIKMKNDQSDRPVTRSMTNKLKNISSSDDAGDDTEAEEMKDPRKAMLAALLARNNPGGQKPSLPHKNEDTDLDDDMEVTDTKLSPGITRLESFITYATAECKALDKLRDDTIQSCKDLAAYCGEDGGDRAATTIFSILSEFVINIDEALKKHEERKKVEERKEAKRRKLEEETNRRKKRDRRSSLERSKSSSYNRSKNGNLTMMETKEKHNMNTILEKVKSPNPHTATTELDPERREDEENQRPSEMISSNMNHNISTPLVEEDENEKARFQKSAFAMATSPLRGYQLSASKALSRSSLGGTNEDCNDE